MYAGSNSASQLSTPSGTLSVRYRIEVKPQSHGRKYCWPLIWPICLNVSGTLSQFVSLAGVDRLDQALVDVELQPAGVGVEDVGLVARLHLAVNVGIRFTEGEVRDGFGVGRSESPPNRAGLHSRTTRAR